MKNTFEKYAFSVKRKYYYSMSEAASFLELAEADIIKNMSLWGLNPLKVNNQYYFDKVIVAELKFLLIFSSSENSRELYYNLGRYYKDPILKNSWIVSGSAMPTPVMKEINATIIRRLGLKKVNKLLEIGMGCGVQAFLGVRKKVASYFGVDHVFQSIKEARKMLDETNLVVAESKGLPFKSDSFDKLLCYSVMAYYPDLEYAREAVRESIRVTKSGGLILLGDIPLSEEKLPKESFLIFMLKRVLFFKWFIYQSRFNLKGILFVKTNYNQKFYNKLWKLPILSYTYDFFLNLAKEEDFCIEKILDSYPIVFPYKRYYFDVLIRKR